MEPIIEVQSLIKEFRSDFWKKKIRILDGVNFTVERYDIFGFIGPNGAGKTTAIKAIMGLILPTSGIIKLFGQPHDQVSLKQKIGFLPESPYFYDYLTTLEFLNFYADLFGLKGTNKSKRIDYLLELVGMQHARHLQLRKFSKGMLQRVGIAQALINDPELVILDEPQTGLDPIGRREVREIILRLKNEKKTVFFSSHIMHDVETICEKVGIITLGRMRGIGRIHDLLSPKTIYYEVVYRLTDGKDALSLKSTPIESRRSGVDIVAKVDDESKLQALIHEIYKHQGSVLSVTPYRETLEDLFVQEVARSGKRVEL